MPKTMGERYRPRPKAVSGSREGTARGSTLFRASRASGTILVVVFTNIFEFRADFFGFRSKSVLDTARSRFEDGVSVLKLDLVSILWIHDVLRLI